MDDEFTPRELDDPIMRKWVALLIARRDKHRIANDNPQNSESITARLRGRNQEITELLALVQKPAQAQDASPE